MKIFKRLFFCFIVLIILGWGIFLGFSSTYVVPVMMYHRVDYTDSVRTDTVNPERFREHMEYIKDHDYHVITLEKLMKGIREGKKFSKRILVITFDDGYSDNYEKALPILKEFGYPATIFVVPSYVGKDGFLTWEQMRYMQKDGISFGSHGVTEAYLPDQTLEKQIYEIEESKKILEERLGNPIKYFSYPVGGFSESIKSIVLETGYEGAVATNRGADRFNRDLFEINRIRFSDKDDRELYLWAKFTGFYNLFRKMKDSH